MGEWGKTFCFEKVGGIQTTANNGAEAKDSHQLKYLVHQLCQLPSVVLELTGSRMHQRAKPSRVPNPIRVDHGLNTMGLHSPLPSGPQLPHLTSQDPTLPVP